MIDSVFGVGDLKIKIDPYNADDYPEHVNAFMCASNHYDYLVNILPHTQFCREKGEVKFEDKNWFSTYERDNGDILFEFEPDEVCNIQYVAILKEKRIVEIYVDESQASSKTISLVESTPFLMCYMMLLLENNGLIMHSAGVSIDDNGYVFCGESGKGKTTISNLFKSALGNVCLTDETLVFRKKNDEFYVYGSPWKGSGDNIFSNKKVAVRNIFFIEHGKENMFAQIEMNEMISIMLKQAFPYFWDKSLMLKSFALLTDITNNVKGKRFYFLPEASAVSFFEKERNEQ